MGITIIERNITDMNVDAVVNAANEGLWAGGGVCGAIFRAAGHSRLQAACEEIGGCRTGSAVITPGFDLKAKHIIHAVGPVWKGGSHGEPELLYSCYYRSLELALDNDCRSIAFPLISSGIFGYPGEDAWRKAVCACLDFQEDHPACEIDVYFAVIDAGLKRLGERVYMEEIEERLSGLAAAHANEGGQK